MDFSFTLQSALSLVAFLLPLALTHEHGQCLLYQPRPYVIDVPHSRIDEIRLKAALYRPTLDIAVPAWSDGPPTAEVFHAAKYMSSEYDWYAYQDAVNANFSHYLTTVPPPGASYPHDLDVHFIYEKSERDDAVPIILLHGWPSTSLEWSKVVKALANPQNTSKPAFDVIAPDLPGYGFSSAPIAPGLGGSELATVYANLMQQLGYESYAIYSTDMGWVVALHMVDKYGERILNHATDFYNVQPNTTDLERFAMNQTTSEESNYIISANTYLEEFSAYAAAQRTFPLAVAHALNDSPLGFLAWMWQVDHMARDLSIPYTLDESISQALTLFIPGVFGNIRSYKELFVDLISPLKPSAVPTSITQWGYPEPKFPLATNYHFAPKDWVERSANVTFFRRHEIGGHFPAYTRPQEWLEDIWDIFEIDSN